MSGEEMKLVSDAKREIEAVLNQSALRESGRTRLRCAQAKLQKALDYMEDETGSGGTDD